MASKPVSVMDSITGILLFAVYIGVVLVLAAMGMNIYTQWRQGRLGSVLFGTNSVTGVITYLAGVDLVSAFMGAWVFMPCRWPPFSSAWGWPRCSLPKSWPRSSTESRTGAPPKAGAAI